MKKLVAVLLLVLILPGLTGCGLFGRSDIDNYQALMQEMTGLAEYRFTGDMTLTLGDDVLGPETPFLFADTMPMQLNMNGTASSVHGEVQVSHQYHAGDGQSLFSMDMIVTDGFMYVGLVSALEYTWRPILQAQGVDMTGFSVADMLDGYRYLKVPHNQGLASMMFGSADMDASFNLAPFLTREGDRFVITVAGDGVRAFSEPITEILGQFVLGTANMAGGVEMEAVLDNVAMLLGTHPLIGARMVMTTSRSGDIFFQNIELEIPQLLYLAANFSFLAEEIPAVGPPERALTAAQFETLMEDMYFGTVPDGFMPPVEEMPLPEEMPPPTTEHAPDAGGVVYDLALLNLLQTHLGPEHDSLELAILTAGDGSGHHVPIPADSHLSRADSASLYSASNAMAMDYTIVPNTNAPDAVQEVVTLDMGSFFTGSGAPNMTQSPLRTDQGRTVALQGIVEDTGPGEMGGFALFYLAQNIPGTGDAVLLILSLDMHMLSGDEYQVLMQLGDAFGFDLLGFVMELTW